MVVGLFGFIIFQNTRPDSPLISASANSYQLNDLQKTEKLWSSIQDFRKSENLKPFIKDQRFCKFAEDRARQQVKLGILDEHKGLESDPRYRSLQVAENCVQVPYIEYTLKEWLSSIPHRNMLLSNHKYSCLACVKDICVQHFSNLEPK